jgi:hypothetical protein
MPSTIRVDGEFRWLIYRRAPGSRWIGVCDPLSLAVEADTLDELYSVMAEGTDLLMRDLLADNEIEQYIKERGWKISGLSDAPNSDDVQIDLSPIDWQFVRELHGIERRAH